MSTTYRGSGNTDNVSPHDLPPCQHCGRFAAPEGLYCNTCRSAGVGAEQEAPREAMSSASAKNDSAKNPYGAEDGVFGGAVILVFVPCALVLAGLGWNATGFGGLLGG